MKNLPKSYVVRGMSCEHCRASVRDEVAQLDGVEGVAVDLATGELRVQGSSFTDDEIRAAVAEAGYELQSAP